MLYGFSECSSRRICVWSSMSLLSAPAASAPPRPTLTRRCVCVATLVHAFVTSRIDYCNGLTACSQVHRSDDRQAATSNECCSTHRHQYAEVRPLFNARSKRYPSLAGCTRTCHIQVMHDRLYKSLRRMGPMYVSDMCRPTSSVAGRRQLRSADRGQLVVPRYSLTTAGSDGQKLTNKKVQQS